MSRWSDLTPERRAELNARRAVHHATHLDEHKANMHRNYVENRDAYRARAKRYFENNREAVRTYAREIVRFRKYGLTRAMFDEYLDAQEGCCAFCGLPLSTNISKIAIDHDHATGSYRGLTHAGCNAAIGLAEAHFAGYMAAS